MKSDALNSRIVADCIFFLFLSEDFLADPHPTMERISIIFRSVDMMEHFLNGKIVIKCKT
jgi:hypothetical protein